MDARVTLITLGVADLSTARAFYEALGWQGQEIEETFYGGYAGYFGDPDGHVWEIAHNPGFTLNPDGTLVLPDFSTMA